MRTFQPSHLDPLPVKRALPRRFRLPRLLLAGCGDVAERMAQQLNAHGERYRLRALLRHAPDSATWARWRALGTTPINADLDQARSLHRLRGIADQVVYLAPPAEAAGLRPMDGRLNRLLAALHAGRSLSRPTGRPIVKRFVLVGTTGVYGDRAGAFTPETTPCRPQSARGQRRLLAEQTLGHWRRSRSRAGLAAHRATRQTGGILRVPGIYAAERLPVERLRAGTPVINADEDSWTNHIHADDLARICWLALVRSGNLRAINTTDHSQIKMGDWFDAVADATGLARPERLPREQIKARVSPMLYSFMSESRRLDNTRLTRELRVRLTYPTVHDFLATLKPL